MSEPTPPPSLNAQIQAQWSRAGSGFTPRAGIRLLWSSFPSLDKSSHTLDTWDAEAVKASLVFMSRGQRHAAAFVLSVWNPNAFRDLFVLDKAFAVWDARHRAAFADWCLHPWFP